MFKVSEIVKTTRVIKAGLTEDGPRICDEGSLGVVIGLELREPDGVHVQLSNGVRWWFKPNQLERSDG